MIGFDPSHSVGVLPHALDARGADFSGWGRYKWLNAGPGSVAGLYLNRRHFNRSGVVDAGLAGWWSVHKENMFEMAHEFSWGWAHRPYRSGRPQFEHGANRRHAPFGRRSRHHGDPGKFGRDDGTPHRGRDAELAPLGFRVGTCANRSAGAETSRSGTRKRKRSRWLCARAGSFRIFGSRMCFGSPRRRSITPSASSGRRCRF